MRKIKHLTVTVTAFDSEADNIWWALVYVPQGTTPNPLVVGA